ncbi:hypothetical protein Dimus_038942 [Dionaea muscipula]
MVSSHVIFIKNKSPDQIRNLRSVCLYSPHTLYFFYSLSLSPVIFIPPPFFFFLSLCFDFSLSPDEIDGDGERETGDECERRTPATRGGGWLASGGREWRREEIDEEERETVDFDDRCAGARIGRR